MQLVGLPPCYVSVWRGFEEEKYIAKNPLPSASIDVSLFSFLKVSMSFVSLRFSLKGREVCPEEALVAVTEKC